MNRLRRHQRIDLQDDHARTGVAPAAWKTTADTPWPSEPLSERGWGTTANPTPKTTGKSTASKTVAWAGGWGGGSEIGWGGGGGSWGGDQEESESEEEEDEQNLGWGPSTDAGAWGVPSQGISQSGWGEQPKKSTAQSGWGEQPKKSAPQPGWKSWSEEAKRLSKATSNSMSAAPSRPVISQHQQSQILNSLLSQPVSQNGYLSAAQQQPKTKQPPSNPYPQHFQSRQVTTSSNHWPPSSKKDKTPQEKKGKHHRSHSEHHDPGGWGTPAVGGWGGWGSSNDGAWGKQGKDAATSWGNIDDGRGSSYGWGKDASTTWGDTGDPWGTSKSNVDGWGPIPEEEEEEENYQDYEDARRVHFSSPGWGGGSFMAESARSEISMANLWSSDKSKDSSYAMPSKTLAHAYKGTTTSLNTGIPRSKINEYTNIHFHDSRGAALQPYHQALFGRARKAKDRIHWMFPPDKDERVASLITWIQTVSYALGSYGLHRFLQSRERGALISNAEYRIPDGKNEPAFDWLTFDQLQETRDKTMQESAAFYDPAVQVIVFVFLPSKSGNSVAMWRRKINVPNNTRLMLQAEITLALAALRKEEHYVVHVDEYPTAQPSQNQNHSGSLRRRLRRTSLPSRTEYAGVYPMIVEEDGRPGKPKKKRKWWHFFRTDW
ncbi:hypothetical protein GYMLUDRAFT_219643 [Collybiopsis luxurians FD-317 M1]|nr:hypothetical protein GYMLUDRAFT_219643 [Collybiopsis luxurians FD-317 M1]